MRQKNLLLFVIIGTLFSKYCSAQNTPWTTNGNIGIGIANPLGRFHVEGGAIFGTHWGNVRILKTAGTLAVDDLGIWNAAGGGGQVFNIADWNTGTKGISINATNGSVGIGTQDAGPYKLAVEGTVGVRKLKVTQVSPWADYVFNPAYTLKPLSQIEAFVKANKYLPEVPSTKEVEKNGIDIGETTALLLRKIEKLTLYVIELDKKMKDSKNKLVNY